MYASILPLQTGSRVLIWRHWASHVWTARVRRGGIMVNFGHAGGSGFAFRAWGRAAGCGGRNGNRGQPFVFADVALRRPDFLAARDPAYRLSFRHFLRSSALLRLRPVVFPVGSNSAQNIASEDSRMGNLRIWFYGCPVRIDAGHRLKRQAVLASLPAIRWLDLWPVRKP